MRETDFSWFKVTRLYLRYIVVGEIQDFDIGVIKGWGEVVDQ